MWSLLVALFLMGAPPTELKTAAAADDEPLDKEQEKAALAERLDLMKSSLKIYEFKTGTDGRPMKLHLEPLLRWNNPVSGVRDGAVFLWTVGGRPYAAAQVFQLKDGLWLHEFQSLAPERFQATMSDGSPVWSPARPGIAMKAEAELPVPAKTERLRLTQMRGIVREYAAIDDFEDKKSRWELRLLSEPVFRYASADAGIIDGALFAFAHGTDPEVFVLVEARHKGQSMEYQIGLAPMTAYAIEVSRKDKVVWSAPYRKPPFDSREPFFIREYHP
jgi:hypothetical protein